MHISRAMQLLLLLLLLLLLELLLLLLVLLVMLQVLLKLLLELLLLLLLLHRRSSPSTDQGGARRGEHWRRRDGANFGHRNGRFRQLRQHNVVRQVVRMGMLAMAAVELVVLLEGLLVLLGHGSRRSGQGRLGWELGLLLVLVLLLIAAAGRRWSLPLIILN